MRQDWGAEIFGASETADLTKTHEFGHIAFGAEVRQITGFGSFFPFGLIACINSVFRRYLIGRRLGGGVEFAGISLGKGAVHHEPHESAWYFFFELNETFGAEMIKNGDDQLLELGQVSAVFPARYGTLAAAQDEGHFFLGQLATSADSLSFTRRVIRRHAAVVNKLTKPSFKVVAVGGDVD